MKKTLLFVFFTFFINPLISQKVESFTLSPELNSLDGQFVVGETNNDNVEDNQHSFLKWLTYYNGNEDIYIDEITDDSVIFTRVFPRGFDMRALKGFVNDIHGVVELGVRFKMEFKDSRYRLLIEKIGWFEDPFYGGAVLRASGKRKEYTLSMSDDDVLDWFNSYGDIIELDLEYRSPEDLKKSENEKLNDLFVALNSFEKSIRGFEKNEQKQSVIVNNVFEINESFTEFPNQTIIIKNMTQDIPAIIEKSFKWFEDNQREYGMKHMFMNKNELFIMGRSFISDASPFLNILGIGNPYYYYITINLDNNQIKFSLDKILQVTFFNECGTGLEKRVIEEGAYEFVIDKTIYIDAATSESITFKSFFKCPAMYVTNKVTYKNDLFNKKGKPRKARTKNANLQISFYNDLFQDFNKNVVQEEKEEDW
tara:strand:- start:56 stop:1327 length:1272 start_codon:yes stop_codon:yes gene_type:complete